MSTTSREAPHELNVFDKSVNAWPRRKILIVCAHPDDEVFGCGGTVAKLIKKNWNAHLLFFTDGVSSRKNKKNLKLLGSHTIS